MILRLLLGPLLSAGRCLLPLCLLSVKPLRPLRQTRLAMRLSVSPICGRCVMS